MTITTITAIRQGSGGITALIMAVDIMIHGTPTLIITVITPTTMDGVSPFTQVTAVPGTATDRAGVPVMAGVGELDTAGVAMAGVVMDILTTGMPIIPGVTATVILTTVMGTATVLMATVMPTVTTMGITTGTITVTMIPITEVMEAAGSTMVTATT